MPPSPKESPESPGHPYELSKGKDTILRSHPSVSRISRFMKEGEVYGDSSRSNRKKVSNKIGTEDDQIYKVLSQKSYRIDGK